MKKKKSGDIVALLPQWRKIEKEFDKTAERIEQAIAKLIDTVPCIDDNILDIQQCIEGISDGLLGDHGKAELKAVGLLAYYADEWFIPYWAASIKENHDGGDNAVLTREYEDEQIRLIMALHKDLKALDTKFIGRWEPS